MVRPVLRRLSSCRKLFSSPGLKGLYPMLWCPRSIGKLRAHECRVFGTIAPLARRMHLQDSVEVLARTFRAPEQGFLVLVVRTLELIARLKFRVAALRFRPLQPPQFDLPSKMLRTHAISIAFADCVACRWAPPEVCGCVFADRLFSRLESLSTKATAMCDERLVGQVRGSGNGERQYGRRRRRDGDASGKQVG